MKPPNEKPETPEAGMIGFFAILGFTCLCVSAFQWHPAAGFAVAGIILCWIAYLFAMKEPK